VEEEEHSEIQVSELARTNQEDLRIMGKTLAILPE
jgi:hypothetical protein